MTWNYTLTSKQNDINKVIRYYSSNYFLDKSNIINMIRENREIVFLTKTENKKKLIEYNGVLYSKDVILDSWLFKRCLIDYYSQFRIWVEGPKKIIRRDGTQLERWIIKLKYRCPENNHHKNGS